uniref:Cell division cycle associated 7 like n=1 Tax=Tetraodon nigroviridis TaxID=99883 RepID=H3CB51_TETNG
MSVCQQAPCFKSKFITAEIALLFSQSDSEEEFEGFSDVEEDGDQSRSGEKPQELDSDQNSDIDTGFFSDDEEAPPSKRKSLLVALKFPVKRLSERAQEKDLEEADGETPPQRGRGRRRMKQARREEEELEEEGLPQSLQKRDQNIQENKAMLRASIADLSTITDLLRLSTPQKKSEKATPRKRKLESQAGSERRNPSRKARPPENFAVEEKSEPRTCKSPKTVDVETLLKVNKSLQRKRRSHGVRKSQFDARSVDEITEEDLENIAVPKDKIWDKEKGSSCHQCRQKTLDTKTICRSGVCVGAKGQFCGPCLKNRYGEDVHAVLLDPNWSCPICRGVCNCSLCRKKEGRCATGNLVGLARFNGHNSVHTYLESIQKELQ